ncbi:hypothetical protein RhiirA4_430311 [Rhizophagus irregularis]|uniref:Uncharacterized protein n=1 Tax=Rhizophagus irregularis TaxID=588596 RepID=A0A2I1HK96_9GLOM|nr:hypothetical protein RhiirA4_430311 [Rhizophagus irregularis]
MVMVIKVIKLMMEEHPLPFQILKRMMGEHPLLIFKRMMEGHLLVHLSPIITQKSPILNDPQTYDNDDGHQSDQTHDERESATIPNLQTHDGRTSINPQTYGWEFACAKIYEVIFPEDSGKPGKFRKAQQESFGNFN